MKVEKVVLTSILIITLIGIYSIISIFVINRVYSTSSYEEEISEMKLYAHDIALGKRSTFEDSYEIIKRDVSGFNNTTNSAYMSIVLKSNRDIRLDTKYNIKIIGNSFIIDDENPIYLVNNPNRSGAYVILIAALFVAYIKFKHIIIIIVEKRHHDKI